MTLDLPAGSARRSRATARSHRRPAARAVAGVAAAALAFLTIPAGTALAADPTPTVTIAPRHHDIDPGDTWTNPVPVETTKIMPKLDVVFVIDDTGSMTNPIRWVKEGLNEIVAGLNLGGASDIHIGVSTFGEREDYAANPDEAYKVVLPLGDTSTSEVQAKINGITVNGGGDEAEDANWALMKAASGTAWREGAQHEVVLISDAPTKQRPSVMVDGAADDYAGAKALLAKYLVHAQLIETDSSSAPGVDGFKNMADQIGADYALTPNAEAVTKAIVLTITESRTEWTIGHEIDCVWESDGSPATDLTVTLAPDKLVLEGGENGKFDETAVAKATTDHPGDAAVCTIQLTLNGVSVGAEGKQTVRAQWPANKSAIGLTIYDDMDRKAPTDADAIKVDDPDAHPIVLEVTNSGAATLEHVVLTPALANGKTAEITDLSCPSGILEADGITLEPGDMDLCTGVMAITRGGPHAEASGKVVGQAVRGEPKEVSATASYWAYADTAATPNPTPTATDVAKPLPRTGADNVTLYVGIAVVLILAGLAITLLMVRARRTH